MKQKDILIILIPLFLLTVLWVIFNIYHSYVTSTIKDPLTIQIVPIESKFDTATINSLKNRQKVDPLYEKSVSASEEPEIETQNESNRSLESNEVTPTESTSEDPASQNGTTQEAEDIVSE
jgi:hypothetical protein